MLDCGLGGKRGSPSVELRPPMRTCPESSDPKATTDGPWIAPRTGIFRIGC